MTRKNYILSLLDELGRKTYKRPSTYQMKQRDFLQKSFQHWAVEEIKLYLEKSPFPPEIALDRFRKRMDWFACGKESGQMFSIAYDVATDILDMLL